MLFCIARTPSFILFLFLFASPITDSSRVLDRISDTPCAAPHPGGRRCSRRAGCSLEVDLPDCWDVGNSYCRRRLPPAVGVCGSLMSAPPAAYRLLSAWPAACCRLVGRLLSAPHALWHVSASAVADFGRWWVRETCDVLRCWERRNR